MASSSSSSPSPDLSLINELLEVIERSPPGIEARKLLVQHYMSCGWDDAARDGVSELLSMNAHDRESQQLSKLLAQDDKKVPAVATTKKSTSQKTPVLDTGIVTNTGIKDVDQARSQLVKGYQTLFSKAKVIHWEMNILRDLFQQKGGDSQSKAQFLSMYETQNGVLEELAGGNIKPGQKVATKPDAARAVARQMETSPMKALDIAIEDLTAMVHWLRSTEIEISEVEDTDNDAIRDALVKRTQALISALPSQLQPVISTAQMHVEHEVLARTYVLSETMYGDPVTEIPREKFWVSEDGYPWDMEELAQAITSNGGVMRNPMSKQLFTPDDVKAIVSHSLGKPLAALQLAQSELSKGVRQKTIDHLAKLSSVLLGDDSADQMASRHVIDEFLAYVATLPDSEQKALDGLRVPAKDSHTGQAYDSTIGEAVRDAQGNRVCMHKIGDFLGQAAQYLHRK